MIPFYPFFDMNRIDSLLSAIESSREIYPAMDRTTIVLHLDDDECSTNHPNKCKCAKHVEDIAKKIDAQTGARDAMFDGKTTIVFWEDGTSTVATRDLSEADDPEKGIMAAMLKHYIGDDVSLVDEVRRLVKAGKRSASKRAARRNKERN